LTFTFLFTKLLSTSLNTAATNLERAWLKIFMAIRLILVCKNGPAKEAYLLEAQRAGIEVDTVESFGELMKSMITNTYQGVMIDLVTSVKASREEKGLAQDVLDAFPVIQLKWDPESKSMRTIAGGSLPDNCTLADFVSRECKLFVPRAVRLSVRKNVYFNVLISRTENMDPASTHRGMTVNVSKDGCFLLSCEDWSSSSEVWFVIDELDDKTPISGEIRWRQPWGKNMALPGIGVYIKQITPEQRKQMMEKALLSDK